RPRRLGGLTPPRGQLLVVSGIPREALNKVDAIVLTPEEYKKLLDIIDQLKKQMSPDKPEVPSKCRLTARVQKTGKQEIVRVQATFEFLTSAANTIVNFGCRGAAAIAATQDDRLLPTL